MSKVEQIEAEVKRMSPEELAQFRLWFAEFDADSWDRQIERDAATGKLDALAAAALHDHEVGQPIQAAAGFPAGPSKSA
jgi:hypothetical protein